MFFDGPGVEAHGRGIHIPGCRAFLGESTQGKGRQTALTGAFLSLIAGRNRSIVLKGSDRALLRVMKVGQCF